MRNVVLKPELRTQGGETVSVYYKDDWAGDLYLVYREGDILTGTIQIDTNTVPEHELDVVNEEVRAYIHHLNSALDVQTSSVVMMYGDISSVVEMEPFVGEADDDDLVMADEFDAEDELDEVVYADDAYDDEVEVEYVMEDAYEDDEDVYVDEEVFDDIAYAASDDVEDDYHLSVAYADGPHTKYHLHDPEHRTLGVVSVDELRDNVSGRVEFWKEPDEDETSEVARMLAQTFNDVPMVSFTMNFQDQHLGDMHVQHQDCLDGECF